MSVLLRNHQGRVERDPACQQDVSLSGPWGVGCGGPTPKNARPFWARRRCHVLNVVGVPGSHVGVVGLGLVSRWAVLMVIPALFSGARQCSVHGLSFAGDGRRTFG